MKTSIKIEGLDRLVKGMNNLGKASQDRILRNASRVGATRVRTALRRAAPRGIERSAASKKFGPLKNNIKSEQLRAGGRRLTFYRVTTGNAFWGQFIDTGTGKFNVDPGPKAKGEDAETHIKPNFWFRRAVERVKPIAERAMVDNARKSILREVSKIK